MCELFGMCSLVETDVRGSLQAFARRGGADGRQKDGWGVAHYVDEDVRLVKEPSPAADSECVRFLQDHPFASRLVLAHIRKATRGSLAMKNCQPFLRELGGRVHVFAHNGDLNLDALRRRFPLRRFHPVGETDSEYAFCVLLDRLWDRWLAGEALGLTQRAAAVQAFARDMRALGPANFIYADGDALFAHGDRRFHGDGLGIHPPGLHVLGRRSDAGQPLVLVASVPLTADADWRALGEGELMIARHGVVLPALPAQGDPVAQSAAVAED